MKSKKHESESLKSSWVLKEELAQLEMSDELRQEVNKFIEKYDKQSTGKPMCVGNISYRSNLHYIIDNIEKPSLLNELKEVTK